MRLFISIPLSDDVRRQASYVLDRIDPELSSSGFKVVDSGLWHLTLVFLGDQDEGYISQITSSIENVAKDLKQFEISFSKLDYGPPGKDKNMLWLLGDKKSSEVLGEVRDSLSDELIAKKVSFYPENKPFISHVTLARREERALAGEINEPFDLKMEIDRLELISSELTPSGPEYTCLGEFPIM